jgi:hypothetical protein
MEGGEASLWASPRAAHPRLGEALAEDFETLWLILTLSVELRLVSGMYSSTLVSWVVWQLYSEVQVVIQTRRVRG